MLPQVTMQCRAVAEPELRFTPNGHAVATIRVVANSRKLNKDTNEWVDDKVCWLDVTVWNGQGQAKMAEHVAESVGKGDLIVVSGRLETQSWEDRESGEKRSKVHVIADDVSVSLRYRDISREQRQPQQQGQPYSQSQPQPGWSNPSQGAPPF